MTRKQRRKRMRRSGQDRRRQFDDEQFLADERGWRDEPTLRSWRRDRAHARESLLDGIEPDDASSD